MILSKTTHSKKRLMKDYKELKDSTVPLCGVSAAPCEDSIFKWEANIRGPENTAYEGGVFHMEITFPEDYPCSPPSIRLCTEVPHPNVFGHTLCLDMLQPRAASQDAWYEGGWCSAYTVESVLIQLQSFLFEVPALKQEHSLMSLAKPVGFHPSVDPSSVSGGFEHRNVYKVAIDKANEFK